MSTMYRLGILGYPLEHSLSPVLHQLFMDRTGVQGQYKKLEVAPQEVIVWLQNWKSHHLNGFNVTIPYKIQVMAYLEELSDEAGLVGAVNTVVVRQDGLYGYNTDVQGFWSALPSPRQEQLKGAHVLVLGTGGACRAVVYALLQGGVGEITLLGRNRERAQMTMSAIQTMNAYLRDGEVPIHLEVDFKPNAMIGFQALINTTPVGMHPQAEQSPLAEEYLAWLPDDALVYDLVYNPLETALLRKAREFRFETQDGLGMLIHQGALAFELWTGSRIPQTVITEARQLLLSAYMHR